MNGMNGVNGVNGMNETNAMNEIHNSQQCFDFFSMLLFGMTMMEFTLFTTMFTVYFTLIFFIAVTYHYFLLKMAFLFLTAPD